MSLIISYVIFVKKKQKPFQIARVKRVKLLSKSSEAKYVLNEIFENFWILLIWFIMKDKINDINFMF